MSLSHQNKLLGSEVLPALGTAGPMRSSLSLTPYDSSSTCGVTCRPTRGQQRAVQAHSPTPLGGGGLSSRF